jgi:DNA repair protein NreA
MKYCILCSGKYWGKPCPIHSKILISGGINFKKNFCGTSPAPFVGHYGYPNVNAGILSTSETVGNGRMYDDPGLWARKSYDSDDVIAVRKSLLNSMAMVNVRSNAKFMDICREVSMSSNPVDIDVNLAKEPRRSITFSNFTAPYGPSARLVNIRVIGNTKIDSVIDKVVDDSGLKAGSAIISLYGRNYDENFLSKLLSVGNIGLKHDRKLVPTKWSITAVDDIIGKDIIRKVKDFKEMDYCSYFGGYMGNYFMIMMFPSLWSYELFETLVAGNGSYTTDYESYNSRKSYAEQTAGGYYASRLAVLEKLQLLKRQAAVLVLRFVTADYQTPLGVWVVRETVRTVLRNKPILFNSKELMSDYARKFIKMRFNVDIARFIDNSLLIDSLKQKKLSSYPA